MLITLADYERAAAESLEAGARAYHFGGADEVTLAPAGADGAKKVLEILLSEFDAALALAGAPRAAELDRSFVGPDRWA
jgi:isopentenyl diphosphate isomerase/L-lactate dehydrogenase-like FMN-dependent dehydrogenase